MELQGRGCNASEATCLSGFTAAFDRAASHPSRSRTSLSTFRTFSLSVAPSSRTRQVGPVSYTHLTLPTICSV
eukprot:9229615-Alexandrium_andersonii.AAC.1